MLKNILSIIPWGIKQIHRFAAYALAAYIILGSLISLLGNLDATSALNIVGGIGLVLSSFLFIPAAMSADAGHNVTSSIFMATVFSYPVVYLFSLFASNWMPSIEDNSDMALAIAALPIINIVIFIGLITVLIVNEDN